MNQPLTVLQVSDLHLSRSHAYFQDNWEAVLEYVREAAPDLTVFTGDVCFNAPDVSDDIAFAREQFDRLETPWAVVPGNHDVGEPGENPRLGQPVTDHLLACWNEHFGADGFTLDVGDWRLVGVNSEVLGSGLAAEAQHRTFVEEALSGARSDHIGLFIHKPLFLDDPQATGKNGKCVHPEPRAWLLGKAREAGVRFVGSGHIHAYHHSCHAGMHVVWAPTTAFVNPRRSYEVPTVSRAGLIEWRLDGAEVSHRHVEPARVANIDLSNWTDQTGTTISLPPLPLRPTI